MRFEFATANRILFGMGAGQEAGALARSLGARAFLMTGRDARRAEPMRELAVAAGLAVVSFPAPGEPTLALVAEATAVAREEGCDVVIGFGGGSVVDAAKAVAALLANGGDLLDYVEVIGRNQPLKHPSVPCLAIPTTAGTGAEVTRNAALASPEHKVKVSLRGPFLLPRVALIDPQFTASLPARVTAFTGMDALTQLIEPFTCKRSNPIVDALCREGIARAARALRLAFHDGSNLAAREEMCVASLFGGLALANAGLGAAHGLAGPIGGMFDAPHGALCAALLPQVMRVNQTHAETRGRYEEVARLLTGRAGATAEEGADWVEALVAELKIPPLSAYGITSEHFPEIIEKAARSSSMKANPVQLLPEELNGVLEAVCQPIKGSGSSAIGSSGSSSGTGSTSGFSSTRRWSE